MKSKTISVRTMPACTDSRTCFAKSSKGTCVILTSTYKKDGQCPFCKLGSYTWLKAGGTWQWIRE